MPRFALLSIITALWLSHSLQAQRITEPPRLLDDIKFLSDSQLQGRVTGSPGADSSAAYLARRFSEVGLQPAAGGWFQSFTLGRDVPAARQAKAGGLVGKNVIGILPGRDPVLRNQTVILGAHYDHLGLGGFGSLDPDSTGVVHNGADDNASGVAALVQVAARLAVSPPARTVVFIAFSGEELGLLGSAHYVKEPIYPLATTLAMVNLDMVGRLRNGRLIVYGARSAKEFPALLDSLNWYAGLDLKAQGDGYGPSDQPSFYAAKRPVLHLFTDLHEDYHRTTDDWDKINVDGLKRVADFALGMVTALANRRAPLGPWAGVRPGLLAGPRGPRKLGGRAPRLSRRPRPHPPPAPSLPPNRSRPWQTPRRGFPGGGASREPGREGRAPGR